MQLARMCAHILPLIPSESLSHPEIVPAVIGEIGPGDHCRMPSKGVLNTQRLGVFAFEHTVAMHDKELERSSR